MRGRLLGLALGCTVGCTPGATAPRVLVLGFDGMDPDFVREHRDRLPNLMRLAERGGFVELETVMPPQSPVAWSTVITGTQPGEHGVFDFVHRRPDTLEPFSSMAETIPPKWVIPLGRYRLPLDGGETRLLRKGRPFWQSLARHGIPSTIMRMPTDFPPDEAADRALSGMGTPDMLGGFGTFQFFTSEQNPDATREVSGGEIAGVETNGNAFTFAVRGPANAFVTGAPRSSIEAIAYVDPVNPVARIEVGDEVAVLEQGEWSPWVRLEFDLVPPLMSTRGIVRFYLDEVDPEFRLYVSPVNIDPEDPELRISVPGGYAEDLAHAVGSYYTQGMAEETKAVSAGLLDRDEFVQQAHIVFDEQIEMFEHVMRDWDEGFLFYYFSTTDQAAHLLYGDHDDLLVPVYEKADAVVGWTLDAVTDSDVTLLVISDHGFERFDRKVHLNTWLLEEGFLALQADARRGSEPAFAGVNWSATRAYAMGLNGLYVNRMGRESRGIVAPAEVTAVLDDLERRLLELVDPETGAQVVERVYRPPEPLGGAEATSAPDLLVGFAPPYRMSPASGLGAVPEQTIEDNETAWIADHCVAHHNVPGVLLSNRPIVSRAPGLDDIAVTVLRAFGVEPDGSMLGENVLDHDR